PDDLAAHNQEPAAQAERLPLQGNFGEEQMRGRAADIDADSAQFDIVLAPDETGELFPIGFVRVFVLKIDFVHPFFHRWRFCWQPQAPIGTRAVTPLPATVLSQSS